jgi:hypothetical protein
MRSQPGGWKPKDSRMRSEYARGESIGTIEGQVLRENTSMLAMCRELGFHIGADPDDAGIYRKAEPRALERVPPESNHSAHRHARACCGHRRLSAFII